MRPTPARQLPELYYMHSYLKTLKQIRKRKTNEKNGKSRFKFKIMFDCLFNRFIYPFI